MTSGLGREGMGERLGGFVYGTIVVLAVIVAGAKAYPKQPGHIAGVVFVTTLVFWLAHVYSEALAHSVTRNEHLSWGELKRIARHEAAILEAAVLPIGALLLGSLGLVSPSAAGWIAVGIGLAVLAVQGIVFARAERLGALGTVVVLALNLGLGLVLVGLKAVVTH